MKHTLEIILTKFEDTTILYKRIGIDISQMTENPDNIVLLAVQKYSSRIIEKNRLISHSTSWRYVDGGETIITYVVYSDEFDFSNDSKNILNISDIEIVESGDPAKPAPKSIPLEKVVSHAIRHLAYLVTNNPSTYSSIISDNSMLRFKEIDIALAGKI